MPFPRILLASAVLAALSACGERPSTEQPAAAAPSTVAQPEAPAPVAAAPAVLAPYTGTPPATTHANCALDAINGASAVAAQAPAGSGVTFEGWVINMSSLPAGDMRVVLQGDGQAFQADGTTAVSRPDVASAVSAGAEMSGFKVEVPRLEVPAGRYTIAIEGADGSFRCATNASLEVR